MTASSIPDSNKTSSTTAVAASLIVTPSATTAQHLRCFVTVEAQKLCLMRLRRRIRSHSPGGPIPALRKLGY